jgi:hypothetical protein
MVLAREEVKLPYSRVFVGTDDPIEERDLVEFRLLFAGELLPSGGTNRRAKEKHAIRRIFHPQLRRLWSVEDNLRQLAVSRGLDDGSDPRPIHERTKPFTEEDRQRREQIQFDSGIRATGMRWRRGDFYCVPLVTADMVLRCSFDILLLRPETERFIFEGGDIDGQVKTLFDALRIPKEMNETGGMGPQEDETPFFCLLEDDRLITEVHVTADKLLLLPNRKEVKENEAFVVIHVKLNHRNARSFDNWFG